MSLTIAIGSLVAWAAVAWVGGRSRLFGQAGAAERFTVAGRGVPYGMGAAALLATWTWGITITVPAQNGYDYGLAGPLYFAVGGGLMLLVFAPFAARVRGLAPEAHTLPEFISRRHGPAGRHVILAINLLSAGVLLFLNLNVTGLLFEKLGVGSYELGVGLTIAAVLAYTLVSGMAASIATDAAQFVAIAVAALVLVPLVVVRSDGVATLAAALPAMGEKGSLLSTEAFLEMGLPFLLMSWFTAFAYPCLWQYAWALRERDVARTFVTAGLGWMPFGFAFGALGVIALAKAMPAPDGSSGIAFAMAGSVLGEGGVALLCMLVLAAASSSCDTALSAFGALFMTDVYRAHRNRLADDRSMLRAGRTAMCVFALLVAGLAMYRVSLMKAMFFLGAAKGAMLFPLLASLYWPGLTARGFVAGIAGGVVVGAGLFLWLQGVTGYYNLISIPVSVAVGAGLSVAVSLVWPARGARGDCGLGERLALVRPGPGGGGRGVRGVAAGGGTARPRTVGADRQVARRGVRDGSRLRHGAYRSPVGRPLPWRGLSSPAYSDAFPDWSTATTR